MVLNSRSLFSLIGGELLGRSVNLACRRISVHLAQPIGSDIEVEYPAARPSAFQPRSVDTSTDVGRASLPYIAV